MATDALHRANIRSNFTSGEEANKEGLRVKMSHTFSLAGLSAGIFLSVSGLTEKEMPSEIFPSGIHCISIQGLTIGGSGVTLGDKRSGYVVLMRTEKGIDEIRYRIYFEKVLLPFIHSLRENYSNWDGREASISPKETVVSWQDGDLAQLVDRIRVGLVMRGRNPPPFLLRASDSGCAGLEP